MRKRALIPALSMNLSQKQQDTSHMFLVSFCASLRSANGARRNSGNGGNDGKMIIIIIDYIGDGGNDIQRLDSTIFSTV